MDPVGIRIIRIHAIGMYGIFTSMYTKLNSTNINHGGTYHQSHGIYKSHQTINMESILNYPVSRKFPRDPWNIQYRLSSNTPYVWEILPTLGTWRFLITKDFRYGGTLTFFSCMDTAYVRESNP